MKRDTQTRWRGEGGQSLLETAMMIVVIFMVVFWTFETGQLIYTYSVLADAANEGVRYAIVHSGGDASGTQTTVKNFAAASKHDVSGIATSVTFPDGNATPPNRVRVTVTYAYIPTLGTFSPSMITYAEGRMVVQ
jgi:Flp pilus assembly protein TadG